MASIPALKSSANKIIVFYFAVPVTLGLLFGVLKADFGRDFSLPVSLTLWPSVQLMLWIAFGAGTWAVCRASARLRSLPLWLVLGLGALVGKVLTWPARTYLVNGILEWHGVPTFDGGSHTYFSTLSDGVRFIAEVYMVPTVMWVGICYMFLAWLGHEFFGLVPAKRVRVASDEAAVVPPGEASVKSTDEKGRWQPSGVLAEIPDYNNEPIICVASDGNYVRLYSRDRHWMIRYTFRTAVSELSAVFRGHQVHRGFWVRDRAVTRVRRCGRVFSLELENGMNVPVARTYSDIAREMGSKLNAKRAGSTQTMASHH